MSVGRRAAFLECRQGADSAGDPVGFAACVLQGTGASVVAERYVE